MLTDNHFQKKTASVKYVPVVHMANYGRQYFIQVIANIIGYIIIGYITNIIGYLPIFTGETIPIAMVA